MAVDVPGELCVYLQENVVLRMIVAIPDELNFLEAIKR